MTVPYWLNEDGDFWVDAEKTPDPIEAAGEIWSEAEALDESMDGNEGQMWLVGRKKVWLKDCPMDHSCEGFIPEEDTDVCHCDNHEDTPCVPEVQHDVWHFTTYPVEGARRLTDSDIYHTRED
jgi:hypothetical protein